MLLIEAPDCRVPTGRGGGCNRKKNPPGCASHSHLRPTGLHINYMVDFFAKQK